MGRPAAFRSTAILGTGITPVSPSTTLSIANSVDGRQGEVVFSYSNANASTLDAILWIWDGTAWANTGEVLRFRSPDRCVRTVDYGTYLAVTGTPSDTGGTWALRVGVRR